MAGFFNGDEMRTGGMGTDRNENRWNGYKMNIIKTDFRIMAASDLHYLSPQLMEYSGKFRELCEALQEPEMERLEEFMEEWLEQVMEAGPDALLITGDLSYQGEKLSHMELSGKLARLTRAGIPVYVVPGNQDLDNPFSACWRPESGMDYTPAETISAREFQEIYRDMGYGSGGKRCGEISCEEISSGEISCAPDSLSYQVCLRKVSGEVLYLFMLDTTIPGSSSGRIAPGTFGWLEEKLEKIRGKFPCLIAGHHPMFPLNEEFVPFVLENGQELAGLMQKYGAPLYISGHLHRSGMVMYSQSEKGKKKRKKVLRRRRPDIPANLYLEKRGLRRIT